MPDNILSVINQQKSDAVLFKAEKWLSESAGDPFRKSEAIKRIANVLSNIGDSTLRNSYVESIATGRAPHKIKAKQLTDLVDSLCISSADGDGLTDADNLDQLPAYMNRDEIEMKGFCEVKMKDKIGYYGWSGSGKMEITNFLIKPIFHVAGKGEDSRHIFEVENRYKKAVMDVKSKVFVSIEAFQTELVAEGGFLFFGSKGQLLRISNELLPQFPMCDEIKQLGWQPEGFFAFVNSVYMPPAKQEEESGLKEIGRWGVVEVADKHFLVPAASVVYENMREDAFEMQRVLTHKKSVVDISIWADKMQKVYGDDGLIGIAYVFCTLFRDICFAIDHNFPHLYAYGERSSGKSKWAESLTAVFYNDRAAFNLNSGTDYAFFEYMRSFRNCPAHLNEFDDKVVKDEWFQAIKGVFDGESRVRGKMGSRTQLEIQKVLSGLILTGQYLSTKDDNSITTRSLIRAFHEKSYSQKEKQDYDELKEWEAKGISGLLLDVLQYRQEIEAGYYETFNEQLGEWRRNTSGEFNSRIFQNWCHLAAMWQLLAPKINLPAAANDFTELCFHNAKEMSKFVRSSDTLTEFWNTVAFLLDQNLITDGWDFKIVSWTECKLRKGDGELYTEQWGYPRKLLVIRLNSVHKLYQKAYKERTGKEGMSIENLKHYFSNRPYYVGQMKATQFKRYAYRTVETTNQGSPLDNPSTTVHNALTPEHTITSAFVFDYDLLGCELERGNPDIEPMSDDDGTPF